MTADDLMLAVVSTAALGWSIGWGFATIVLAVAMWRR